MRIACLAWGSLVWDPRELPVLRPWRTDGPAVPVEFARVSRDGRLTLVIVPQAQPQPALWSLFDLAALEAWRGKAAPAETLEAALQALREREGTVRRHIGCWRSGSPDPPALAGLGDWAKARDLDAVLWTALPPKFAGEDGRVPSAEEAVEYLARLEGEARERAERYVRQAPAQIDTAYRRAIAARLGWTPAPPPQGLSSRPGPC
ncbi:MAG: hypothetical protein RML12_00290 [Xanthomonadales bacterium]|nr:hypothetical protein [Xanthomonadales bacterium]